MLAFWGVEIYVTCAQNLELALQLVVFINSYLRGD